MIETGGSGKFFRKCLMFLFFNLSYFLSLIALLFKKNIIQANCKFMGFSEFFFCKLIDKENMLIFYRMMTLLFVKSDASKVIFCVEFIVKQSVV